MIVFLVYKSFVNNVIKIENVSPKVAYLTLRVTKRYSLMYGDISRAVHISNTYYAIIMGDFNVRLGKRNADELRSLGVGGRNR